MTKGRFIVLVVLLAIGAGGGLLLKLSEDHLAVQALLAPTPKLTSEEADFALLEEASVVSCMCKRAGNDSQKCSEIYTGERKRLMLATYGQADVEGAAEFATACAPISTQTDCIEFKDGIKCVVTSYYVNGASSSIEHPHVCTANEARAVESAYEQAWPEPDGAMPDSQDIQGWNAANDRANRALDDMLVRILAGERVAAMGSTGGCVG